MDDLVNNLENTYGPILVLIGIGIIFIMYWLPSIIALFRGHQNKLPIILINFFFGWTFLGWIGTFIWSLVSPTKTVVVVNQNPESAKSEVSGELNKLHELKEKGVITESEFLSRKDKLLRS